MNKEQYEAFMDAFKVWYADNHECYYNEAQAMGDYVGSILFHHSEGKYLKDEEKLVDFKAHAHSQIGQWLAYYPLPADYLSVHFKGEK